MFCNHCGATVRPDDRFCPVCGRSTPAPQPSAPAANRVARHLGLLAIFWAILSGLRLLHGSGSMVGARIIRGFDHGWPFFHWLPDVIHFAGLVTLGLAVLGFIAAWGLHERLYWARTLVLVLAFFALFNPPLGTALGIYTLWVFLPAQSAHEYQTLSH